MVSIFPMRCKNNLGPPKCHGYDAKFLPDLVGTHRMEWGRVAFGATPDFAVAQQHCALFYSNIYLLLHTAYSKLPGLFSIFGLPEKPLYQVAQHFLEPSATEKSSQDSH